MMITMLVAWALALGCAWAESLSGPWKELEAPLRDWSAVVQSMPAHPQSKLALDALSSAIPGNEPDEAKLLALALAYPDSPLGLYALESYWATSPVVEAIAPIWSEYADTRVGVLAFDLYVDATRDLEGACARALSFGEVRVAQHARVRLAETSAAQSDWLTGLTLQLHAFTDALLKDIKRAERLFHDLNFYFEQSALPQLQPEWSALMVQDVVAEHHAAKRLAVVMQQARDPMTPMNLIGQHLGDPNALAQLMADASIGVEFQARTALLLARHAVSEEDDASLIKYQDAFLALTEAWDGDKETLANLLLAFLDTGYGDTTAASARRPAEVEKNLQRAALRLSELLMTLEGDGGRGVAGRTAKCFERHGRYELEVQALERAIALGGTPEARIDLYKRLASTQWLHLRDYHAVAHAEAWLAENLEKSEERERAAFAEAVAWYLAEDYPKALTTLTRAGELASVLTRDRLLLTEILVRFRQGDIAPAAALLDARLQDPTPTDILPHLKTLRAYMRFAQQDYDKALDEYLEVVRAFPDDRISRPLKFFLSSYRGEASAAPTKAAPSQSPNILLVSVDTVRADHLSCLGYPRPITPNIDKLAERGALFERAYSTSSWTKPAHASLFTGLYPQVHGAMGHDEALLPEFSTLPEMLREAGYATMGVISAPPLHRMFGFARGFQHYDDQTYLLDRQANLFLRGDGANQVDIHSGSTSSLITDAALRMLSKQQGKQAPFFLFVNYFDAHHNYLPSAAQSRAWCEPYAGTQYGVIDPWNESPEPLSVSAEMLDVDRLRDLYAAEVNHVDAQVGRLITHLEENGLLEKTIIIVFSDHGEEFLEHGRLAHGRSLHEEVIRVPLVFAGPGIPKGERVRAPVSLVDVMPTTLSLLQIPFPETGQGEVLIEKNQVVALDERELYAWLHLPPFHHHATISGDSKLIRDMADGRRVLYDLRQDAAESIDKLAVFPEIGRELNEALERFLVDSAHQRSLHIGAKETRVDAAPESVEEMEAQLRALGYVAD